jgi:hypothetical protein
MDKTKKKDKQRDGIGAPVSVLLTFAGLIVLACGLFVGQQIEKMIETSYGIRMPWAKELQCGDWLESEDQLTSMPKFPQDHSSLLAKHLTEEVWNEYKDSVDDEGVSFKQCIFSGCKNVDSGIGVYAGSISSYRKFSKLFDPVIQAYHGHSPTATHVSDMDASKLVAPALPTDEAAMIRSTRIRVGRNLDGYPLGSGVTKA